MGIYKYKNFRLIPPTGIENGDTFIGCNLIQVAPHTAICTGIIGLTFTGCNLTNCDVPENAIVDNCGGYGRHKSRCSHLHPEMVEKGLPVCTENCSHVVDIDKVYVDGVLVDATYHYRDTRIE